MSAGGGAGTTAQDILVAHEFPVVLAQRAGSSAVAGVWRVGAACPLPDIAKHLLEDRHLACLACQAASLSRSGNRMKQFGLHKIAFDWRTQRRTLPLEFGR